MLLIELVELFANNDYRLTNCDCGCSLLLYTFFLFPFFRFLQLNHINVRTSLIVLLLSILSLSLKSQNVVDGIYVQENILKTRYDRCCNSDRNYGNELFVISQVDSATVKLSDQDWKQFAGFAKPPFEQNDLVYFNPASRYIGNYSKDKLESFYFYLNTLDYGQRSYSYRAYRGNVLPNNDTLGRILWRSLEDVDTKPTPKTVLPYSLRFYVDEKDVFTSNHHSFMRLDTAFIPPLQQFLTPFYFRKHEVTNGEYREFYEWVRDSIAHLLIGENHVMDEGKPSQRTNWDAKIDYEDDENMEILEEMYLPENQRFFRRREIDTRKMNYEYWLDTDSGKVHDIVNVYPDTTKWIDDYYYSYNEPMTNHYFWHPAYAEHPVVGVSYRQARAYLHWKTKRHNAELVKNQVFYRVSYQLPTEAQWDMVATSTVSKKAPLVYPLSYQYTADRSWITDLSIKNTRFAALDSLSESDKMRYIAERDNLLIKELNGPFLLGDNPIDSQFHTYKADISKIKAKDETPFLKANQDELGICFMGGNVSEWLLDDYETQWKPIFDLRQKMLQQLGAEDTRILSELERYFDSKNDRNGKLVRGGNWYDERYSELLGKNVAGTNAKTFVHPDSSHCTLGFRYVITVLSP